MIEHVIVQLRNVWQNLIINNFVDFQVINLAFLIFSTMSPHPAIRVHASSAGGRDDASANIPNLTLFIFDT